MKLKWNETKLNTSESVRRLSTRDRWMRHTFFSFRLPSSVRSFVRSFALTCEVGSCARMYNELISFHPWMHGCVSFGFGNEAPPRSSREKLFVTKISIIIGIDHRDDDPDAYPRMMRSSCRRSRSRRRRWFRNARRRDDRGYYRRAWRREWRRA